MLYPRRLISRGSNLLGSSAFIGTSFPSASEDAKRWAGDPQDVARDVPSLPPELWIHIINLVKETSTLFVLSHASSTLRTSVWPIKTVQLFLATEYPLRKEFMLELVVLRKLQDPQLAAVVTEFRIKPSSCHANPYKDCICSDIDDTIGHIIRLMVNLEVLDIACAMDRHPQNGRHDYFRRDQGIRRLRCVSFTCKCGSLPLRHGLALATPIFSTVEALRWTSTTHFEWSSPGNGEVPKLTALEYCGSARDNRLLAMRPIKRICSQLRLSGLNELYSSSGDLTYLVLDSFLDLQTFVATWLTPFINLQHIGTIPPISPEDPLDSVDAYLAPFISLPRLTSIDARVSGRIDPWNAALVARVREIHSKIQRVLIRGDKFHEWVPQGTTWVAKPMPQFFAWDIIRGACD